jgi:hypothetical protein
MYRRPVKTICIPLSEQNDVGNQQTKCRPQVPRSLLQSFRGVLWFAASVGIARAVNTRRGHRR